MRKKWIVTMALAVLALLLGAGPVLAQGGSSNAIINRDYVLAEGQTLNQDLLLVGGSLRLERDSHVVGNVVVAGGEALINGLVDGDVVVLGGGTELGPSAVVNGDLVVFGQLHRSEQSQVLGNTVEGLAASQGFKYLPRVLEYLPGVSRLDEPADIVDRGAEGTGVLGSLGGNLLMLVLAVLAVALMPLPLECVARTLRQSALLSIGVGILTWVLGLMLMILLAVICIGLPVALVLLLALILAQVLGWIAAGQVVGQKLLALLKVKASLMGETLAGTFVLGLLASIPSVGWLLAMVVSSWGVGAVVLTRFGALEYPVPGAATAAPPADARATMPLTQLPPQPPERDTHETKPLDPTAGQVGESDEPR